MTFLDLPDHPGWKVGDEVSDIRGRPPASPLADMVSLFGQAPGDWEPRLYLIPSRTHLAEIVEHFEVGSHGALRFGWDERDTTDLVSDTLSGVEAIVPGSIEFASPHALRFRFARRLRQDEVDQIESVYERCDELQAGLDHYVNGWSGESLLHELLDTGLLHLRWD